MNRASERDERVGPTRRFLADWIARNVRASGYPMALQKAQQLSASCHADADRQGIATSEIDKIVGNSEWREFMLSAMMAATNASMHIEI